VAERPYLLVSCAMSVDGYIDDASPARLILSSEIDADRVDEVRAGCDAILVGARTVRRDNPRLLVRSPERRIRRLARGATENPVKVTITASGDLDPAARFFAGNAARLVYCARPALATLRERLAGLAEVVDAGDAPSPALLARDLAERGMARVLLEGGGELATQFLAAGLADELQLVIAPFFVGDPAAPRFALPGRYPHGPDNRMQLAEVRQLGDVVLLRYLLGTRHPAQPPPVLAEQRPAGPGGRAADDIRWLRQAIDLLSAGETPPPAGAEHPPGPAPADIRWLREAIELSRRCPPSQTAYSVGAAIVAADGTLLATGFSREADPHDHAEEVALAKVPPGDPRLPTATLYSSLEPCGVRASRPFPCSQLIIAAGLRRVAYAWREPPLLAAGGGGRQLRAAGVTVVEVPELAPEARQPNAHLISSAHPPPPDSPPAP
jgi:riboflavin-specific deaminase-like protein